MFCAEILPALSFLTPVINFACAVTRLLIHLRSREGIPKAARGKNTRTEGRSSKDLKKSKKVKMRIALKSISRRARTVVRLPSRERKCISRRGTAKAQKNASGENDNAGMIFAQKQTKSYMVAGDDRCARRARHHFFLFLRFRPI